MSALKSRFVNAEGKCQPTETAEKWYITIVRVSLRTVSRSDAVKRQAVEAVQESDE